LPNSLQLWWFCGLIVLVAIASKLLVSAASIRARGLNWRESLAVGALVNTRGLVELVILNVGLDLRILSPTLFSMMVIMALVTTFMTAPLLDLVNPELTGQPENQIQTVRHY
jgi:Kef-type K+ transport system membrane component KefB